MTLGLMASQVAAKSMPQGARVEKWKTFHFSTVAPSRTDFAATWLAIWPSVIGRRPKGVVVICVCIFFHLSLGNRKLLAEKALTAQKSLDCDSRKCDSLAATQGMGFRKRFRWPFSLPIFPWPRVPAVDSVAALLSVFLKFLIEALHSRREKGTELRCVPGLQSQCKRAAAILC